ncbi:MAG TPA: DUF1467 family protein [Amphiplicatus sp.]|nr:DUF1467 family protein [Amphiplicatus sp.]
MGIAGAIVTYILLWWGVFFVVLPWGVRGRWESDDDGVSGAEPGAPAEAHIKRKMLITSGIAAGLWVIVVAVIMSGLISFRE